MGHLSFNNDGPLESTVSPLPDGWAPGLLGVGIAGALSFASTTVLFLYMTYAWINWNRQPEKALRLGQEDNNQPKSPDLSLGLDVKYLVSSQGNSRAGSNTNVDKLFSAEAAKPRAGSPEDTSAEPVVGQADLAAAEPTNPFLVLIYNLLIADGISSLEFTLNLVWVSRDGIFVPSAACTLQAVAAGAGAFSPSVFLAIIALHTYLAVVWGVKIGQGLLRWCLVGAWGFIVLMPLLGLAISRNGEGNGGWFVRGDTWCSANSAYEKLRFWTEFMPVIICLIMTVALYVLIGISMFRNKCSGRHLPSPSVSSDSRRDLSGHHPAFFVYPVVYLVTMAPLGICRLMIMAGAQLDAIYYFVCASIIASQGLLNSLLWTLTIMFLSREEIVNFGLDHFMRTPDDRVFGNIVYIQGGSRGEEPRDIVQPKRSHRGFVRMASVLGDDGRGDAERGRMQRSSSQMSLRHPSVQPHGGIQMETITTIIVEDGKPASRSRSQVR